MKKTTRTFTLERETPNTIRYREEPDAGELPESRPFTLDEALARTDREDPDETDE